MPSDGNSNIGHAGSPIDGSCLLDFPEIRGPIMFGINDPWIISVFALNIVAVVGCVAYGVRNWHRGDEDQS